MEKQKGMPNLRIKEILVSKGMTAKALAEKMGKSPQYLNSIINGGKGMSMATLAEVAISLNVEFWQLFTSSDDIAGKERLTALIQHKGAFYKASTVEELEEIVLKIKSE